VLAAGQYSLAAYDAAGASAVQSVTAPASGPAPASPLQLGALPLSGKITDGAGNALGGASISVAATNPALAGAVFTTTTAADGTFTVSGLPAGSYSVQAIDSGFAIQTASVALPSVTSQEIALAPAVSAAGVVTDAATGLPISGAFVQVLDPATGNVLAATTADASGAYAVGNLPSGPFDVLVLGAAYQEKLIANVTASTNPFTLNVQLAAPTTALSGIVTDGVQGVAGAQVWVANAKGEFLAGATTASDGSWTISQLMPGTFTVLAKLAGYHDSAAQQVSLSSGVPATATLALTAAATDDLQSPFVFGCLSNAMEWVSNKIGSAFTSHENNPPPARATRDHYPPLPAPTSPCAQAAYNAAAAAERNKDAAYDAWVNAYNSYNTTTGANLGILATQITNALASLYGAIACPEGEALISELQAAPAFQQVALVGLNVAGTFNSAMNYVIDAFNALDNGGDAAQISENLAADLGGQLSGGLSWAQLAVALKGEALETGGLNGYLVVAANLASTIASFQDAMSNWQNQANTTVDAMHNYYSAFFAYEDYRRALVSANAAADQCNPPPPPNTPTPPNADPSSSQTINAGYSHDPNDKMSTGFGAQGYVAAGAPIIYTINFENDPTATLAAQKVVVTDPLDASLDPASVQLGSIEFAGTTVAAPSGVSNFSTTVDITGNPDPVTVNVALNASTHTLTWTMQSIDPATGQPVQNPLAGFLPPDDANHDGEGFVTFTARPLSAAPDGTTIHNTASIVFDTNAPIITPTTLNTLDAAAPSSAVTALPTVEPKPMSGAFAVSWTGADGASGVAGYNVYVSDDGGAYQVWQHDTSATSAAFPGQAGHSYRFYSVAIDNAGNVQSTPAMAQAATTVSSSTIVASNGAAQSAATGTPFSATLVSFADSNPSPNAVAQINWGDGAATTGTVVPNGQGGYAVSGSHFFDHAGTFNVTVAVSDGAATTQATDVVTVTGAPTPMLVTSAPAIAYGQTATIVGKLDRSLLAAKLQHAYKTVTLHVTNGGTGASKTYVATLGADGSVIWSIPRLAAGSYSVQASYGKGATAVASPAVTLIVGKVAPTLSAAGGTFAYNGKKHALKGLAKGLGGVKLGNLIFTYNGSAAAPTAPGAYAVVASYAGNIDYSPMSESLTMTITGKVGSGGGRMRPHRAA